MTADDETTREPDSAESPPVTEHTLPGWMTNVTAGRNVVGPFGEELTVEITTISHDPPD